MSNLPEIHRRIVKGQDIPDNLLNSHEVFKIKDKYRKTPIECAIINNYKNSKEILIRDSPEKENYGFSWGYFVDPNLCNPRKTIDDFKTFLNTKINAGNFDIFFNFCHPKTGVRVIEYLSYDFRCLVEIRRGEIFNLMGYDFFQNNNGQNIGEENIELYIRQIISKRNPITYLKKYLKTPKNFKIKIIDDKTLIEYAVMEEYPYLYELLEMDLPIKGQYGFSWAMITDSNNFPEEKQKFVLPILEKLIFEYFNTANFNIFVNYIHPISGIPIVLNFSDDLREIIENRENLIRKRKTMSSDDKTVRFNL